MPKPFSIQAPEAIAKEYAGNKQRIAEAARMGIVDPTAAVLAGMFIDRMRGAQMQEGATPPTVAQEVMGGPTAAPSPPAGGLGMTPQAAPPMTPQMPTPMQGMPMDEMGAQMPMGEMGAQMPMGMAEGGMTYAPMYTQGGLDGLPIPDTMFDENRNGGFNDGYAGGGIIAFNEGAAVPSIEDYFGRNVDPLKNRAFIESLMGKPQTKYADEEEAELLAERSPEARKKARNLDLGYALMTAGSKMASTPGGLLQSLGAGIGEAAPVLMQSAKERKAEERDIRKGLRDIEAGRNTAAAQRAAAMMAASETAIRGNEVQLGRDFTAKESEADRVARRNDLLIKERGDTLRTGITAAAANRAGANAGLTPGQYLDAQKALNGAKTTLNLARARWEKLKKPKTDDKLAYRARVAQTFIDAEKAYKEMESLIGSMSVRGGFSGGGKGGGQSDVVDVAWK